MRSASAKPKRKQKRAVDVSDVSVEVEAAERDREYEIERIVSARLLSEAEGGADAPGGWMYLVKWSGYPASQSTWEPAAGLVNAKRMVAAWWRAQRQQQ